ncbi:Cytochrome P450 76C4 [Hordeum vulgare]|uniref:cytochrome P450 76M5-like n=1 Tax=Hordeum vulgare subsp. vulgare TaxID=112509 RepID=UPI000B47C7DB|nr:cytochrome P450 76M5-like [Hordeum vulgare subsp. vulgare]KAE8786115.1 Cytochrome P450 76C4 [Hordeum vulgare]
MEIELWQLWATLAFASLLYYLANTTRRTGTGRMPPGPTPLPVVGNVLSLGGNLHHTLARLARAHGPVMTLKLGLTTAVVVSSRDAACEAFTKHDRRLAARAIPDAARALGFSDRSIIWLPSSDPLWKSLRGVVATNVFSPRGLAMALDVRERKVRDMVSYLRARAGKHIDVGQALYGGVLNLVSNAFCSVDVVDMGGESAQGFRKLVEDLVEVIAKPNVSDLVPFLRPLDLQGWRRWTEIRFQKIFLILDGIIDRRMAAANASTEKHGDFLDSLLELFSTGKMTRDSLTTIVFEVFAAGSDTMSITVEWAMAELLRNPRVMAKVREEIDNAHGGKETIGETDAARLPYLQAVVKEAMRLHPVAPILLPHRAVEEGVEIGGYAVPKGSTVIFNAWAIMRDREAWERPDEFVPERFLDLADQVDFRGKAFEFIPFGSGRRLCPGLPMAERVVPFILASLLHAFEWRLPDGVSAAELDVSERFTSANVMAVPLMAVPVVVT